MIIEIWKDIKGFPKYQVSNKGRVRSLKFGVKILNSFPDRDGSLKVNLRKNNRAYVKKINILILETFQKLKLDE